MISHLRREKNNATTKREPPNVSLETTTHWKGGLEMSKSVGSLSFLLLLPQRFTCFNRHRDCTHFLRLVVTLVLDEEDEE